jgi:hypothetical protein
MFAPDEYLKWALSEIQQNPAATAKEEGGTIGPRLGWWGRNATKRDQKGKIVMLEESILKSNMSAPGEHLRWALSEIQQSSAATAKEESGTVGPRLGWGMRRNATRRNGALNLVEK